MKNELLNRKTKTTENDEIIKEEKKADSNERNCCFETERGKGKILKIKDFQSFVKEVSKIKSPCAIGNLKNIINAGKDLENGDIIDIELDKIEKDKIIPLASKMDIKNFFNEKQINEFPLIFSSIVKTEKEIRIANEFKMIHTFDNYMSKKCEINKFCIDYQYHFPENSILNFYSINRNSTRKFRIFYYHKFENEYISSVVKFFGPSGSGKSIVLRMILCNYNQFDGDYTPFCIFNIKLLNKLYENYKYDKLKEIIYHECYSLFTTIELWKSFIQKINIYNYDDAMELVEQIIDIYITDYKDYYPLFVIDNYSHYYDEDDIINKLEKKCFDNDNFNLYIIYDIRCKEDQKIFTNLYSPNKKIYNENDIEYKRIFFHFNNLKSFSEIKTNLIEEGISLPENYEKYFGDNSSYFFSYYKNKEQGFSDFVYQVKQKIIIDIKDFYKDDFQKEKIKYIYENIKNKNVKFNIELFESLPGKYINFNKTLLSNDRYEYNIDFSFPLIKECFEEIIGNIFFINVRDNEFMKLEPIPMGISFDLYMIDWIKKQKVLFGYTENEIEFIEDKEILEKGQYDITGRQMFMKNDIIKYINETDNLIKLKKECENKNLKTKKLIIVTQVFNGKSVDFIIIVYNEQQNKFILNSIQIKLTDTYKIKKSIKERIPLENEYIREKYSYIMNIEIENTFSYFSYLGLYELPKKFATDNLGKFFFYSRDKDILVDKNGNELKEIPYMEGAKIIGYQPFFLYKYEVYLSMYHKNPYILKEKKNNICLKEDYSLSNNEAIYIINENDISLKYKINNNNGSISNENDLKNDNSIQLYEIIDNSPNIK